MHAVGSGAQERLETVFSEEYMGNNMGGKCSTMTCTECSGKQSKCKPKTMGRWARLQTSGRSPSPRSGHDVAVIDNKVGTRPIDAPDSYRVPHAPEYTVLDPPAELPNICMCTSRRIWFYFDTTRRRWAQFSREKIVRPFLRNSVSCMDRVTRNTV